MTARRLSEGVEATTGANLQIAEARVQAQADMILSLVSERAEQNVAWWTLQPLVHGLDQAGFSGWLAAGGGALLVELLESETDSKLLFVGQRHEPHGFWADRELYGLHPRPSLTVTSGHFDVLRVTERGAGEIRLQVSDGLVADMESGRLESLVSHQLPVPVAGEPLVLSMSRTLWDELSSTERAAMAATAANVNAHAMIEGQVANRMARTALPLPTPVPLPAEFKLALASAIDAKREQLAAMSPLAADILASQAGYRAITGTPDLAQASHHYAT